MFYSYVFVGGVKRPYTAAKLTAYAVHDGFTMPATQVDALDASSLTFPVPAYLDKDDYIVVTAYKSPEAYVYQEVAFLTVPVISDGLDGQSGDDDNKAPVIISSAAGAIASFPDGADDLPAKKITAYIEPIQSGTGTPAPDNIRPITGWYSIDLQHTGINIFGGDKLKDALANADSEAVIDTTNETILYSASRITGKTIVSGIFKENTRYTMFCSTSSSYANLRFLYADGTYTGINPGVNVSESGRTVAAITGQWQSGDTLLKYNESGLFEGVLTAADFEPFNGTTYHINMPQAAGTVYGGYVEVNEDGSWKIVVDKSILKTTDLTWTRSPVALTDGSGYYTQLPNVFPTDSTDVISDSFNIVSPSTAWELLTFGNFLVALGRLVVTVPLSCTTNTLANDYLHTLDASFVYPLATPQVYTLSAVAINTYFGVNNFYNNAGNTAVEYRADTKLYIERLTIPDDVDMIADNNIASGKFFMVGNDLYLSTAAIAAGAQITVGTNAIRLSLADALNQINT